MVDVSAALQRGLAWLYPPVCLLCDADAVPGLDLCDGCRADLPWAGHYCNGCGLPLPAGAGPAELRCGSCLARPPPFVRCHVVFAYARPVDWLVTRMKFGRSLAAARLLGQLMADTVHVEVDAVLPVPLHKKRLRERGFNQALEIARPLAKRLRAPLLRDQVRRIRETQAQSSGLNPLQRRRNLAGAFTVRKGFAGAHILLVDDVMTTGATALELTRVLLKAGAGQVSVCCAARTPRPDGHSGL